PTLLALSPLQGGLCLSSRSTVDLHSPFFPELLELQHGRCGNLPALTLKARSPVRLRLRSWKDSLFPSMVVALRLCRDRECLRQQDRHRAMGPNTRPCPGEEAAGKRSSEERRLESRLVS